MSEAILTPIEARIIAVLLEKQRTVPDSYPMSLSGLVGGCNQKSARDPVMSVTDQDVLTALDGLRRRDWVIETSGSRVMRYEQNAVRVLQIAGNGMILLAVLVLRGPQTVAELRSNSQRWYSFADASSVEAFLEELAERSAGALVTRLARQPGARESRWAHLLCGDVAMAVAPAEASATPAVAAGSASEVRSVASSSQSTRVDALEERVNQLEAQMQKLLARISDPEDG